VAKVVLNLGPNSDIWRAFDAPRGDFYVADESGGGIHIVTREGAEIGRIENAVNASVDTLRDRVVFLRSSDPAGTPMNWNHQFAWIAQLDPVTGRLLGAPRRATVHPCIYADISADGSRILCARQEQGSWSIYTLPAAGGDEHLVTSAHARAFEPVWSRDGKWIYFNLEAANVPPQMERVSSAGGIPQRFASAGRPIGVSRDGKYFAAGTNKGPLVRIFTIDGKFVRTVNVPGDYPSWSARAAHSFISGTNDAPMALKSLDVDQGATRVLPTPNATASDPQFSPDGRRLVYRVTLGGRDQFVVADADGAHARTIGTRAAPSGESEISPDSRWLVFASRPGDSLYVLNLASGTGRSVLAATGIGTTAWTEDSRAIIYVKRVAETREIHRLSLDGRDTLLRQVGTFGVPRPLHIVSDSTIAYVDTTGVHLMSLESGVKRTLVSGHTSTGCIDCRLSVSADRRWIGFELDDSAGAGRAYMAALDGTMKRPIGQSLGCGASVLGWHPNGRDVFLYGFARCDTSDVANIYLASIDGGPMRNLTASETSGNVGDFAVSPDGRHVAYTVAGVNTASLYMLDLSKTLP